MTIDSVHKLEKAVVQILNFDGWQLKWTGEGGSRFDAEGLTPLKNGERKRCVIEMKFRNKYYSDKLLEKSKYDALMSLDDDVVKLYFVADPKGNYLYWLNNMTLPDLQVKNIKKTTMWQGDVTAKELYMLPESKAVIINTNDTQRPDKGIWDEYHKRRADIKAKKNK